MTDLSLTIAPRSDQMNADDLIGRSMTVKVTKVALMAEADQPIAIYFEGDGGKPFKPCKSIRRVLVTVWGSDGAAYVGRRMTLYRDDKVQFGGMAVGGIRVSHMSHIDAPVTLALTATRATRKPYTVKPLPPEKPTAAVSENLAADATVAAGKGVTAYQEFFGALTKPEKQLLVASGDHERLKAIAASSETPHDPVTGEIDPESGGDQFDPI